MPFSNYFFSFYFLHICKFCCSFLVNSKQMSIVNGTMNKSNNTFYKAKKHLVHRCATMRIGQSKFADVKKIFEIVYLELNFKIKICKAREKYNQHEWMEPLWLKVKTLTTFYKVLHLTSKILRKDLIIDT